ncbi:MAG: hypothetical protein AAGK78_01495, partial [Planctomycetota bacterium]
VPRSTSTSTTSRPCGPVSGTVESMVYNTNPDTTDPNRLRRPIDVAFGSDGSMWLLDMGEMRLKDGNEIARPGTGRLYRLAPPRPASTQPTTEPAAERMPRAPV